MRLPLCSLNQRLPSAPTAMMRGELPGVGSGYCTSPEPSGFMRPMALPALSVNQSCPSRAIEIVVGALPRSGSGWQRGAASASGNGGGGALAQPARNSRAGRGQRLRRESIMTTVYDVGPVRRDVGLPADAGEARAAGAMHAKNDGERQ